MVYQGVNNTWEESEAQDGHGCTDQRMPQGIRPVLRIALAGPPKVLYFLLSWTGRQAPAIPPNRQLTTSASWPNQEAFPLLIFEYSGGPLPLNNRPRFSVFVSYDRSKPLQDRLARHEPLQYRLARTNRCERLRHSSFRALVSRD